jgi:hypothetical protein
VPLVAALAALGHGPSAAASGTGASPTIVRLALPAEGAEGLPVSVPTQTENTTELDFPWPVADWAGRGFTPDPEKFAGDFVIEATRGSPRVFITPVAERARRVLHAVLAAPGGRERSVALEFLPAPGALAWRTVVFDPPEPPGPGPARVALEARPPPPVLRESGPESELGLLRTLRLMLQGTAAQAAAVAAANPALALGIPEPVPRSFGDFTVTNRFALRDATTGSLGLCASVENATPRRLFFDPLGWVVRAGDRVYPAGTVDFPGEVEPGDSAALFLVLSGGADGASTRLSPDNDFRISAVLLGSANPRPVSRMTLPGFEPR